MDNKAICILFFILLFSAPLTAKTATEAVTYVSQEKYMLSDNENATIYPLVKISYENKDYWVVSILVENELVGFIPLEDPSFEIPSKTLENTEIIKLAYFLRLYDDIKTNAQQQSIWLFNLENEKFFSDLAGDYYNETFEVETVKTELPTELYTEANTLKSLLTQLSTQSAEASALITDIRALEQSFYSQPSDTTYTELLSYLDSFFTKISDLEENQKTYLTKLNSLKLEIAKLSLSTDTKQSLNSILNHPNKSNSIPTKTNYSLSIQESLSNAETKAETDSFEIASTLPSRIQRGLAYSEMYAFSEDIFSETNAKTLQELIQQLNSSEYTDKWEDQASLTQTNDYWKKAEIYYTGSNYQDALTNAQKAKSKALTVYSAGLQTEEPGFQIPVELLSVLFLALVAVYLYQNKDKFFQKKNGEKNEENPFSL